MSYTKQGFVDFDKTKPLKAAQLILIEEGIIEAQDRISHLTPAAAVVGQYLRVTAVDASGRITAVETADAVGEQGTQGPAGENGSDGADGADGEDGFSPTVEISKSGKVTTITITDASGPHTATINDGEDGKDGEVTGSVDGLPAFTAEDYGKVLSVTADGLVWTEQTGGTGEAMTDAEVVTF